MSDHKHDTKKTAPGKTTIGRRAFISKAALGAGAMGVAAVTVGAKPAAAAAETGKSLGYRETEHVKTYYNSAKF